MIIQHNISAINSYRNLGINQSALSKNLEKLSSGYKINRAGDNAAGLAISESMRSQINGLNQASANAKDAIGLIKTAEGALSEVHSMLQRMTTLAEQAANGTYNTVARGNIQEEYKALTKEIKRISENADFNGIKPLTTGKEMTMTFQIGPTSGETITVDKEDIYGKTVTAAMSLKLSVQKMRLRRLRRRLMTCQPTALNLVPPRTVWSIPLRVWILCLRTSQKLRAVSAIQIWLTRLQPLQRITFCCRLLSPCLLSPMLLLRVS